MKIRLKEGWKHKLYKLEKKVEKGENAKHKMAILGLKHSSLKHDDPDRYHALKKAYERGDLPEEAPTNNVGGGNLAGMGVHGAKNQEPGVKPKDQAKNKSPVLFPDMMRRTQPNAIVERETFAGSVVFEVAPHTFHMARMSKRKGKHWRTYLEEDDGFAEIREFANRNNSKGIILQNERTGEMCYARYPKKRG